MTFCQHRKKTFEYIKIQESLPSENLAEYYLSKGTLLSVFSTLQDIIQAESKTNKWIS